MAEVVAVLARYPMLRVAPVVDHEDGVLALTVSVAADEDDGLQVLALADDLRYVADMATIRHLSSRYDIPAARLEALLPERRVTGALGALSVKELAAVVEVLEAQLLFGYDEGDAHGDISGDSLDEPALVRSAVLKLAAMGHALTGGAA